MVQNLFHNVPNNDNNKKQGQGNQCRTPGVKFWANTVVFLGKYSFIFGKYSGILGIYSGILGKYNGILGKDSGIWGQIQWYFGQIRWYFGQIQRYFGQIQWYFEKIQWYFGQIQWYFGQIQLSELELKDIWRFWSVVRTQTSPGFLRFIEILSDLIIIRNWCDIVMHCRGRPSLRSPIRPGLVKNIDKFMILYIFLN